MTIRHSILSVCLLGLLAQNAQVANQLGQSSLWNVGLVTTGAVIFVDGTITSCPAGYTEVSSSGNYILLTTHANNDVGTTGGSNAYTPAGTLSWPAGVPTFTGSQVTTSAVSAGTPAGTNASVTVATVSGSKAGTSSGAFSTIGGVSPGSSFTVPAETFTGSALATHTHTDTPVGTVAWPAGVPTLAGTQATIQPTFLKLIPCRKN